MTESTESVRLAVNLSEIKAAAQSSLPNENKGFWNSAKNVFRRKSSSKEIIVESLAIKTANSLKLLSPGLENSAGSLQEFSSNGYENTSENVVKRKSFIGTITNSIPTMSWFRGSSQRMGISPLMHFAAVTLQRNAQEANELQPHDSPISQVDDYWKQANYDYSASSESSEEDEPVVEDEFGSGDSEIGDAEVHELTTAQKLEIVFDLPSNEKYVTGKFIVDDRIRMLVCCIFAAKRIHVYY